MAVVIYEVSRVGGMGVRFEGKDGTSFVDPQGLRNPQVAGIVGKRLRAYVRCEVGEGVAEVVGEASAEEVAAYEGRGLSAGEDLSGEGAFRFPGT
jgi:hypothetical protein